MSNEVTEIINTLCEKLGVAANILVPEMARYYIARLIFFTLIETTFAIVVAIVIARIMKWILVETMDADFDLDERVPMIFFTNLIPGVLLAILFIAAVSSAADLIGWIASPTASAIREIASMVK